ncbi:MAG TPA: hypothetical protein VKT28_01425 [Puia sp.]|nr:hypothetical protein [Puia sp.]
MIGWDNFFVAIVGAAAALTGLIFVGVSINLSRILSLSKITSRALESLILLLNVAIIGALCLVPQQSSFLLGIEILSIGIIVWGITLKLDIDLIRFSESSHKKHSWQNILFSHLAVLPYVIAGILTLSSGFGGIYWLIPGIIFSFIKALIDAWVLLVEINR